jgi:uncharacterized protein (TIGR02246 family)
MQNEESKILAVLDSYVKAFQDADPDALASLHWLDDERFSEIEDMIAYPFGKETYMQIADWMRKNAKPGTRQMKFHKPSVFFLSPDIAYAIAIQEIATPQGPGASRVTLIFLRKDSEWRILHGHFSEVPKE